MTQFISSCNNSSRTGLGIPESSVTLPVLFKLYGTWESAGDCVGVQIWIHRSGTGIDIFNKLQGSTDAASRRVTHWIARLLNTLLPHFRVLGLLVMGTWFLSHTCWVKKHQGNSPLFTSLSYPPFFPFSIFLSSLPRFLFPFFSHCVVFPLMYHLSSILELQKVNKYIWVYR